MVDCGLHVVNANVCPKLQTLFFPVAFGFPGIQSIPGSSRELGGGPINPCKSIVPPFRHASGGDLLLSHDKRHLLHPAPPSTSDGHGNCMIFLLLTIHCNAILKYASIIRTGGGSRLRTSLHCIHSPSQTIRKWLHRRTLPYYITGSGGSR